MELKGWKVTMSVGVVTKDGAEVNVEDLVSKADALMYTIKESGRGGLAREALSAPQSDYLRSSP